MAMPLSLSKVGPVCPPGPRESEINQPTTVPTVDYTAASHASVLVSKPACASICCQAGNSRGCPAGHVLQMTGGLAAVLLPSSGDWRLFSGVHATPSTQATTSSMQLYW